MQYTKCLQSPMIVVVIGHILIRGFSFSRVSVVGWAVRRIKADVLTGNGVHPAF